MGRVDLGQSVNGLDHKKMAQWTTLIITLFIGLSRVHQLVINMYRNEFYSRTLQEHTDTAGDVTAESVAETITLSTRRQHHVTDDLTC